MSVFLSERTAFVSSVLATACYVGFLYLIPAKVKSLPRADTIHIRYRLWVVTLTTALLLFTASICLMVADIRLPSHEHDNRAWSYLKHLSVSSGLDVSADPLRTVHSLVLTAGLMAVFYAGPIAVQLARLVVGCRYKQGQMQVNGSRHVAPCLLPRETPRSPLAVLVEIVRSELCAHSDESLLRNLLVGPVTEELVFRGLMVPVGVTAHCVGRGSAAFSSCAQSVCLWSPLFFVLAHVHHLYETLRGAGAAWRRQLLPAVLGMLLQMTYTGIFGVIAGLLLIRTGSLWSSMLSHVICNTMQLPDVSFASDPAQDRGSPLFYLYPYRWPLLTLHALGLGAFAWLLFPATDGLARDSVLWSAGPSA